MEEKEIKIGSIVELSKLIESPYLAVNKITDNIAECIYFSYTSKSLVKIDIDITLLTVVK